MAVAAPETPLVLASMGSYIVGGRVVAVADQPIRTVSLSGGLTEFTYDPNGSFQIEHAYVQYMVPARLSLRVPVVLVHGGGMTGSCWETTPDGRPGWTELFLRAGLAVHVVDMVERGRAGFSALPGQWPDDPISRSAEEAWSLFRIGPADGFATRTTFDHQKFPVGHFDELVGRMVPRWLSTTAAQQAALDALVARLGHCVLVGHSQGGGFVASAAAANPSAVRGVVTVEPHGVFEALHGKTLSTTRLLVVKGDYLDASATWSGLANRFDLLGSLWSDAGGSVEQLSLAEAGMPGHTHLPMMDLGSEHVARLITDWIKNLPCL